MPVPRIVLALSWSALAVTVSGCFGPECTSLNDCPQGNVCSADGSCVAHEVAPGSTSRRPLPELTREPRDDGETALPTDYTYVAHAARIHGDVGMYHALDTAADVYADVGTISATAGFENGGDALVLVFGDITHLLTAPGTADFGFGGTAAQACADRDGMHYDEPVTGTIEVGAPISDGVDPEVQGFIPVHISARSNESNVVVDTAVPPFG